MIFAINPPCKTQQWEGLPNRCHPFLWASLPIATAGFETFHSSELLQISSVCFRLALWTFPEIRSMIALTCSKPMWETHRAQHRTSTIFC
jgi:hypothetical protein